MKIASAIYRGASKNSNRCSCRSGILCPLGYAREVVVFHAVFASKLAPSGINPFFGTVLYIDIDVSVVLSRDIENRGTDVSGCSTRSSMC